MELRVISSPQAACSTRRERWFLPRKSRRCSWASGSNHAWLRVQQGQGCSRDTGCSSDRCSRDRQVQQGGAAGTGAAGVQQGQAMHSCVAGPPVPALGAYGTWPRASARGHVPQSGIVPGWPWRADRKVGQRSATHRLAGPCVRRTAHAVRRPGTMPAESITPAHGGVRRGLQVCRVCPAQRRRTVLRSWLPHWSGSRPRLGAAPVKTTCSRTWPCAAESMALAHLAMRPGSRRRSHGARPGRQGLRALRRRRCGRRRPGTQASPAVRIHLPDG